MIFKCKLNHSEISKLWMPNLLKIRHSDGFQGRSCCLPILPILGKSYSHGNGLACPRQPNGNTLRFNTLTLHAHSFSQIQSPQKFQYYWPLSCPGQFLRKKTHLNTLDYIIYYHILPKSHLSNPIALNCLNVIFTGKPKKLFTDLKSGCPQTALSQSFSISCLRKSH